MLVKGLLALLGGLQLAVGAALVHSQGGRLPVGLAAGAAGVGLAVRVHHVVLVQARVLGEALPTAWHRANVWLLPWGHWAVRGGLGLARGKLKGQEEGDGLRPGTLNGQSWERQPVEHRGDVSVGTLSPETGGEQTGGWGKAGLVKGPVGSTGACKVEGLEQKRQETEKDDDVSGAMGE